MPVKKSLQFAAQAFLRAPIKMPRGILIGALILTLVSNFLWAEEPPSPIAKAENQALVALVREISAEVSHLRGFPFASDVAVGIQSQDELRSHLLAQLKKDSPDEEIAAYKKVLIKFGLVPPSLDLKEMLIQIYLQNIAGFYDPEEKKMYLVNVPTPTSSNPASSFELRITLAHELTHALQDQTYGILKLPVKLKDQDDLVMACEALLEGDAFMLMLDYASKGAKGSPQKIEHLEDSFAYITSLGGIQGPAQTPEFIKEDILFPYVRGLSFIRFGRSRAEAQGWERIDSTYRDLPLSTEQILHPDKYFDKRDDPVALNLPDISSLLGEPWSHVMTNTVGEFDIAVLLSNFILRSRAEKAAAGWGGDRYALYERRGASEDGLLLVWYTTWDTLEDAEEFYQAYRNTVTNKYRHDEIISEEPGKVVWKTEEGFVSLERQESDVTIIEGAEEGQLGALSALLARTGKSPFSWKGEVLAPATAGD